MDPPVRLRESDARGLSARAVRGLNRLAVKIAFTVSGMVLIGTAGVGLLAGSFSFVELLALPAIAWAATYVAGLLVLGRRIELARTVLHQIRNHRFHNLEAAHLPRGDELNDLIWQVYRTGQVLEREFSELKEVENFRREFIGNVSHELKTPIFAIRGFAETLENGAIEDVSVNRSFVGKILRNAERLSNLARDLGEISRIETGELKMRPAPFSLASVVADCLESLERIAGLKDVTLSSSIPNDLPSVVGDVDHVRQVLVNLIENAIKYNDGGGSVEIFARLLSNGDVKISVVDNGIGISDEYISRITERFFRVDRSRSRSQGGTGLGLAIVKHILGAHDRSLLVESRTGAGSTFGFSLPTAREKGAPSTLAGRS